ncbi:hypothetical protein AJ79_02171 [Helicocarpus griseus UAMH5409]|uniref:Fungal STAND N-terminal Goodbye domain-containing protein n=1 Tax=Helicocarpus griseus UAMH5409 TaxID=1447875 RepID=A0A2B7Y419_9EURO|nr:hypothetical protein AJ79_02171 [Helicocarpus griseus UAMH5409]
MAQISGTTGLHVAENFPTSDVPFLWQQALEKYQESTGKALQQLPRFARVEDILKDTELQEGTFNKFRHNGGMVDRLRSSIARNASFLESLKFVVDAAALAFPPTAAISSAIFYVLQVTKHVSSDYDKVIDFFDSMKTFLERLSIIQGKLPSIPAYTSHVVRVFSAMLSLCGISATYIKKGRLKKLGGILIGGGADENLKSAHAAMEKSLTELESASVTVILANTEDLKKDSKNIIVTTERIDTRTERIELSIQDQFRHMSANFEQLLKSQRKDPKRQQLHDPGKVSDARTRKHVAFSSVKQCFETSIDPAWQARDIEYSFVKGSAKWVLEEGAYQIWREGKENPYLWISGNPGLGKTCVAFSLAKELTESLAAEPKASVAAFYFQNDHAELVSVSNAMSSIIIQIAGGNSAYCEQASSEIGKSDGFVDTKDLTSLWERFFQSKFRSKSNHRLFLIIDGLDEISTEDRSSFLELLAQIRKESLNMHVLFTCRGNIKSSPSSLQPLEIIVTKEKLQPDMRLLVEDRMKRLPNLYTFRKQTKRRILFKILERADSMLYVHHMLRRYNSIGREGAVLKDLQADIPDDLQSLYNTMLNEIQQRRTSEHLQIYKRLLAWLAFANRLLSVEEVGDLAMLLGQDRFDVIEEVEGRLSRILRITRPFEEENRDEEIDDMESSFDDDVSTAAKMIANDNAALLQFQDRSLRDYFRSAAAGEGGLRTESSCAHLLIFEMSVGVICGIYKHKDESPGGKLKAYATKFWTRHFMQLDPLSATEPDVLRVTKSLTMVLSNHNNAAKQLEVAPEYCEIFGKTVKRKNEFLISVSKWVERASMLGTEKLDDAARVWVESAAQSPLKMMVPLARGHISNCFQQLNDVIKCFNFAANALLMASATDLCPTILAKNITKANNIKMVMDVFSDIPKDEMAYQAMAVVLKNYGHREEAITACKAGLAISKPGFARFQTSVILTAIYVELYDISDDGLDDAGHKKDTKGYNMECHKIICEALSNKPSVVDNPALSKRILPATRSALLIRAYSERAMGNTDAAVKSYDEARTIWPTEILAGVLLNEITSIYAKEEKYTELIENVEQWTFWERMAWLTTGEEDDRDDIFRHAASQVGKGDFLIKTYEEIIAYLDRSRKSASTRWELASYYQTVKRDFANAKTLLYEIIDGDSFIRPSTGSEDLTILSDSRLSLCDIIYEEFRRADTIERKMALMEELKDLQTRGRRAAVDDGNRYETASSIAIAHTYRKMGPAHAFQDILEKTFEACMSSLTDDKGWNDQNSLCLLAKVLALVGGLEREAQIAFSAQFYIIDPEVDHEPSNNEESDDDDDEEEDDGGCDASIASEGDSDGASSDAGSNSGDLVSGSTAAAAAVTEDEKPSTEEDIAPYIAYTCFGECKDREMKNWDAGPIYMCMVCTCCDLCEECYLKQQAYNKGSSKNKYWKTYCGPNHWYIKGPVEGCKGIKKGYMTIGEERVRFMDWLEEVREVKWKRAWELFWRREEVGRDIL